MFRLSRLWGWINNLKLKFEHIEHPEKFCYDAWTENNYLETLKSFFCRQKYRLQFFFKFFFYKNLDCNFWSEIDIWVNFT